MSNRKTKKAICLYDSRDYPNYDEYLQFCKENDFEPQGEFSTEFYDFCNSSQQASMDVFVDDLGFVGRANEPVIISGVLGRWDGCHDIYITREETLLDAIRRCGGSDDLKVMYEDGLFRVFGYHHDGTNEFEIKSLSKAGLRVSDNWYGKTDERNTEVKDYMTRKFIF